VHHGCGSQGGALSGAGGGDDGDFGCVGAGGCVKLVSSWQEIFLANIKWDDELKFECQRINGRAISKNEESLKF
jgi:hypothetical protein